MAARRVLLVGVVLSIVIAAGCLGASEGDLSGDMSENEFDSFVEDRTVAEQDLETHTVSIDTDVSVDDGAGRMGMTVDGAVNNTAEEARIDYDIQGNTAPTQPSDFEAYFDDSAMYMERSGDEWDRIELDDLEDDNVEDIWELNETTANDEHYYYGDVAVDEGEDTISITTELDGDEMEAAMEESGADMTGLQGLGSASFEDVTIEEEVDAETNLPETVEMEGEVSESGETVSFSVVSAFDDHDEPVDAEIPDDVRENATEPDGIRHPMT